MKFASSVNNDAWLFVGFIKVESSLNQLLTSTSLGKYETNRIREEKPEQSSYQSIDETPHASFAKNAINPFEIYSQATTNQKKLWANTFII